MSRKTAILFILIGLPAMSLVACGSGASLTASAEAATIERDTAGSELEVDSYLPTVIADNPAETETTAF